LDGAVIDVKTTVGDRDVTTLTPATARG